MCIRDSICAGQNINITDGNGDTPLHCACRRSHASMVAYLLSSGANTQMPNRKGETASSLANVGGDRTVQALFGLSLGSPQAQRMAEAHQIVTGAKQRLQQSRGAPLNASELSGLKGALGPSLVGQMERLGLTDELRIMADKLEWSGGAQAPPQRQFRDSTPIPMSTPPVQSIQRELRQVCSPATMDSLREKFLEKQIENRLSPKSQELLRTSLSSAIARSPPPTDPEPCLLYTSPSPRDS
eukprot:TRINITY_DN60846_c0_g1_i1.p1 TRINITY_DN60846_c0_g1~~TRINITY_DN60846_c0_g1_i1.p1  ORF type:complete len:241 (+),score=61.23 TRINITY_DN60846_c0_g1_i1:104-826(+)